MYEALTEPGSPVVANSGCTEVWPAPGVRSPAVAPDAAQKRNLQSPICAGADCGSVPETPAGPSGPNSHSVPL